MIFAALSHSPFERIYRVADCTRMPEQFILRLSLTSKLSAEFDCDTLPTKDVTSPVRLEWHLNHLAYVTRAMGG
jgi:hypothetical protein